MSSPAPKPLTFWRRYRVPLLLIPIPIVLLILERLWDRFELSPEALMYVGMAMTFSFILVPLVILIWFLFFSSFTRQTRLTCFLILVGLVAGAIAITRKVEFSGQMKPIVYFRWDHLPQDNLAALTNLPAGELLDVTITAADSPFFRGPLHDGTTPSAPKDKEWTSKPMDIFWRHPVGGGHAGIAVAGQVAITIEQRGDHEAIIAYKAENGLPVWVHQYPAGFHHSEPMGGDGPRTTPTIVEGLVYTLGAQGHLHCLETATGKVKWQQNILEDAGAKNLEWGMSGTPLVVGDKVIVNPGIDLEKKTQQAVIAYDRMTGKKAWSAGGDMAGYSSMMKVSLAGVEQLLLFDAAGLKGLDLASGKQLWLHPWKSSFDMNCAQPIIVGADQVYISSQVANGGAMVKVSHEGDAWKTSEVWKNKYLGINFSNAVLHEGYLYGLSNGYLTCLDAKTGERKWKARQSYGNGQILLAGDVLVITAEDGYVALVATDAKQFKELKKIPVFSGRTWNVPAIARGRLYLRNHQEMACVRLW